MILQPCRDGLHLTYSLVSHPCRTQGSRRIAQPHLIRISRSGDDVDGGAVGAVVQHTRLWVAVVAGRPGPRRLPFARLPCFGRHLVAQMTPQQRPVLDRRGVIPMSGFDAVEADLYLDQVPCHTMNIPSAATIDAAYAMG